MSIKRQHATARAAVRNFSRAATNAQRATNMAITGTSVMARRLDGSASAGESARMVMEKIAAANSAWWGLGAAMMTAGPRLVRASTLGRGPFAVWETALAMSVQSTAAVLDAQRAVMAPMWAAVRANGARLGRE